MKLGIFFVLWIAMIVLSGMSYAAEDKSSLGTQIELSAANASADKQSLGGQAGEVARDLKGTAEESYTVTSTKVAETAKKVEADAQDTFKTLQKQWDVLAKQLQEKTQQIQKQLEQQIKDFNKSLNQPSKE